MAASPIVCEAQEAIWSKARLPLIASVAKAINSVWRFARSLCYASLNSITRTVIRPSVWMNASTVVQGVLCAHGSCPDMVGHAPTNLAAIYVTLLKVSQMIADLPDLCELDINPLLADAQGVLALDARIRVRPAQPTIGGAYCENFWNDAHEQPKHEQSL